MPSLFDQFTGTCSVTTLKKLPSDDSSLKNPTMQVKMKLFDFFSKKIKKMTPTPSLCSRPDHKRRKAEVKALDDQAKESLIKLRTLLSMYNPEHYSSQILSTYKDVWIQKIEDAYYAYNCSLVHLNEKEEEELVHDDVLRFVVKTLNKASSSVNLSTSTIAANVSDVSTSDVTSTTEDAAEPEVNPDDSNESSKCTETIAESNPKVIEEVAPQNQVQSKAPVTNEMVRGPNGSMISRAVADKMFAFLIAHSNAVFGNKANTNLKPDVEEANDVAPAHPHPEVVPSPVLFHRDRGRSDEFILDLPGCSSSQTQSEAVPREPDPTQEVSTLTDATDVPAPADMSLMMAELSSYPSCPKPTSVNLKECHEWIIKYESFLHKLHSAWSTQHKQVMQDILRPFSSSMMEDVFVLHRPDSACRSPEAEDKIRSILILTGKLKISAPLEPDDPEEVYSAYSDHSSLCARLRSSRCRRKDSRSW